jgi:hypothetical protein
MNTAINLATAITQTSITSKNATRKATALLISIFSFLLSVVFMVEVPLGMFYREKIKCKNKFISLFNEYENVILKVEAIG